MNKQNYFNVLSEDYNCTSTKKTFKKNKKLIQNNSTNFQKFQLELLKKKLKRRKQDSKKVAGAVIYTFSKNKLHFLCVYGNLSNKWGFPKGHMKYKETTEECTKREVNEETGIKINKNNLNYLFKKGEKETYYSIKIKYEKNLKTNDPFEIKKIRWFTETELQNIKKENANSGLRKFRWNVLQQFKNKNKIK